MQGLVAGIVAVALAITARTLRPGETGFLVSIIRPLAPVAALPALWVLVQVLPLRVLAHPIWKSAETALGRPVAGGISVDPGASVIPLGQYLSVIAVAFLSAAVAVDRQRAEWILFALTAAVTAIALVMLTHELFFPEVWLTTFARAQAINCVGMGTIIASAACICTIERYETRRSSPQRSGAGFTADLRSLQRRTGDMRRGGDARRDARGAYCDGIRHPSTRVRGRQRSHKNVLSYRTQRAWRCIQRHRIA